MLHVREIIKELAYCRLIRDQIIPNIFNESLPSKRYPKFVYERKSFDHFGLFCDYLVRKIMSQYYDTSSCLYSPPDKTWQDDLYNIYEITSNMYNYEKMDKNSLYKYINFFKAIEKYIKSYDKDEYLFDQEWCYESIQGHPDIISSNIIYDIKTTTKFQSMREETILQLLSYYCLCKTNLLNHTIVSVILPMQKKTILYDLSEWNWLPFLNLLEEAAQSKTLRIITPLEFYNLVDMVNEDIGSHISKTDNICLSIKNYCDSRSSPFQIFYKPPMSNMIDIPKIETQDIINIQNILHITGNKMFVHAQYTLNLCRQEWSVGSLTTDLKVCHSMGGHGVVFHVGKSLKQDINTALDTMHSKMKDAIEYASEECPLLLETPAGQGTEVLTSIKDMISFYNRFTEEEKKKLGLCIDTCHVFVSGYDPIYYINTIIEHLGNVIKLIHYNDSKVKFGTCNDSHYHITWDIKNSIISSNTVTCFKEGYIGLKKMLEVALFAKKYNIPMVTE